ncbi:hypothetical protein NQ317_017354 [Molorchus minor]|uniref:Uncharacterized protein n=1 Tax=Molorchus minor TaxID=1323400 RepID=A0ABQ9IQ05_9CUCU|nr:hypothetical protein NQ317_017354 [Molorchus minor]
MKRAANEKVSQAVRQKSRFPFIDDIKTDMLFSFFVMRRRKHVSDVIKNRLRDLFDVSLLDRYQILVKDAAGLITKPSLYRVEPKSGIV